MKLQAIWKIAFLTFFVCFSINQGLSTQKIIKNGFDEDYIKEFSKVMNWLIENSDENDIVLTEWTLGNQVIALANRKVIATSKVYPSEVEIVAERYKDISKFFFATSEASSLIIVNKYNISFIFLDKNFNYRTCRYINICNLRNYQKYLTSKNDLIPQLRSSLIVSRMLDKDKMDNYELVYNSKNFLIYKVAKKIIYSALNNTHSSGFSGYKELIEEISKKPVKEKYSEVYGGIIPHDIIHSYSIIASFFQKLNRSYKTIMILGPDHFHTSKEKISTSLYNWETPFGILKPDLAMIEKLNITDDEYAHIKEHSIRTLLPFIKYKYPNTKIVPIILRNDLTKNESNKLSENISKIIENDTLVLAGIDFSHIRPADANLSIKEDAKSLNVIRNFEKHKIDSLNIDSKPSLLTLLNIMENINATKTRLFRLTNSALINKNTNASVGYISLIFMRENVE